MPKRLQQQIGKMNIPNEKFPLKTLMFLVNKHTVRGQILGVEVLATFCEVCEGAKRPNPEGGGVRGHSPGKILKWTRKWSKSKAFWKNISQNLYH